MYLGYMTIEYLDIKIVFGYKGRPRVKDSRFYYESVCD